MPPSRDRGADPRTADAGALPGPDGVAESVGGRIRSARQRLGLSLRALSAEAGVSIGLLSEIERGLTDPSLQTLRHVSRALDVPLFDFFQPPEPVAVALVRRDRRVGLAAPQSGVTYTRISPGAGHLELLEGTLAPGGASSPEPWAHASEECVLVTSGTVGVEVGGEIHMLEVGDSCYFDSRLPHRYVNDGDASAVFIVAVTPPSY